MWRQANQLCVSFLYWMIEMTEVGFLYVHADTSVEPMTEHVLGSLPYQGTSSNTNLVYIFQCL